VGAFLLQPLPILHTQALQKFHVDWKVRSLLKLPEALWVKLPAEIPAVRVKEPVVGPGRMLARAIEHIDMVRIEPLLQEIVFRDLSYPLHVILLLQIFFHEILVLKRFMIKTFGEIFPKLIFKFT